MSVVIRTNLPTVVGRLRDLKEDLRKNILRAATRAGAQAIAKAARNIAPRKSGALAKQIRVLMQRRPVAGTVVAYVTGRQGKIGDAFYWRFQEHGWIPRGPGNKLRGGDKSRALARSRSTRAKVSHPYILPAFNISTGAAIDAFYRRLEIRIAQENAKSYEGFVR